jgi:Acyl-CoA carboxylase epsilon subunit
MTPAADPLPANPPAWLTFVRGDPSPEELAAVVAVLARLAAQAGTALALPPAGTRWTRSGRPGFGYRDGRPARPGPGAWRGSALPR